MPFVSFSQQPWEVLQDDSLGFSIKAPFEFDKKVNEAMTEFGLQEIISYGIKAPDNHSNYLYQIMVIPYPDSTFHPDSTAFKNLVIQEFIDASHDTETAEKIYQTNTLIDGQEYEQWVIHHGNEYSIKSRATIKNNALFVIQVITDYDKSVNVFIDKYLDSFKFIE